MKKYLALVLSAFMLLAFAACARQPQPAISTDTQQILNPWTDYASLDEAETAAGYDLAIPDAVDGCSEKQFRALDADGDKMIEVIYASGEDEIARIRKAPGAEDISGDCNAPGAEDISGDCNAYAEQTELTSGDAAVTMKGADGLVQLAIWQADGYTYAVSVENGLTADAMAELVAQVR